MNRILALRSGTPKDDIPPQAIPPQRVVLRCDQRPGDNGSMFKVPDEAASVTTKVGSFDLKFVYVAITVYQLQTCVELGRSCV